METKKTTSSIHAKIAAGKATKLSPELLAHKLKQEYSLTELTILIIKLQQESNF
jgi:hypothetical protein